jgi:hypothetical protein
MVEGSISFRYVHKGSAGADDFVFTKGLEDFCLWAVAELRLLSRNIEVTFERGCLKTTMGGCARSLFHCDGGPDGLYKITLDLDSTACYIEGLRALAHEFIHAVQWSQEKLSHIIVVTKTGVDWGFRWEGSAFQAPATKEAYESAPWEVEANARMASVVNDYISSIDN